MKDLNLLYRAGVADTKYDGKNVPTAISAAGNLAATFVSNWIDHGSILKQVPLDGFSVLFNVPRNPQIVTTGGPTNFTLVAKLDLGPDASTVESTIQGQTLTFTVTSNAATGATYTKDGVASTTTLLPLTCKLNIPFALDRYSRLTLTLGFTGGASPALDATGFGAVDAWVDFTLGPIPGVIELN